MTSVSILIPCFNAAAFLRSTLESAIENMEDGDEIVLVDDHSTDGSLQLARGFLQNENINMPINYIHGKIYCITSVKLNKKYRNAFD